jgi:hypothetical protein
MSRENKKGGKSLLFYPLLMTPLLKNLPKFLNTKRGKPPARKSMTV